MAELADLDCIEAKDHFGPRTVAILPTGATEPHGPHLPLDTDVRIAVAVARCAAAELEERGVRTLQLPPLAYGITRLARDFAGGVTLRPGTLWAVVEDVVLSLQQDDVRQLVVCNGHLEAEQTRILRGLAVDFAERGPGRCQLLFPDRADPRWGLPAGEGIPGGHCHAGVDETSLLLALDPAAVRADRLEGLPACEGPLRELERGAPSLAAAGAELAYCGDPAAASAEAGRDLLARLAGVVVEAVRDAWPELFPGSPEEQCR